MVPIKHIIVTIAGGSPSISTAKYSIYLAKLLQARLTVVYVVDEKVLKDLLKSRVFIDVEALEYERELEGQGKAILSRVINLAQSKGVEASEVFLKGVVHQEVVNKTRELDADLLVMGDLKEVFSRKEVFYDEGERIFREAPCPVVVVKNPAKVDMLFKEL